MMITFYDEKIIGKAEYSNQRDLGPWVSVVLVIVGAGGNCFSVLLEVCTVFLSKHQESVGTCCVHLC